MLWVNKGKRRFPFWRRNTQEGLPMEISFNSLMTKKNGLSGEVVKQIPGRGPGLSKDMRQCSVYSRKYLSVWASEV